MTKGFTRPWTIKPRQQCTLAGARSGKSRGPNGPGRTRALLELQSPYGLLPFQQRHTEQQEAILSRAIFCLDNGESFTPQTSYSNRTEINDRNLSADFRN